MQGRGVREQGRRGMKMPVAAERRRHVLWRAPRTGRELRAACPRRTPPGSERARCRRGAGGGGTRGCADDQAVMSGDIGIGIVGYGIMGKAHSYGYTVAPVMRKLRHRPRLRVISGRDQKKVNAAAVAYGVESSVTDWRELVRRPDVDIVDICTPPGTHAEIAIAAAGAGKAVICEKPLAVSYTQAASAVDAAVKARILNAVGFNYRRLPAVSLMKRMIGHGAIGEIRLVRASWLSDEFADPTIPFDWRFDRTMGGTTIADLGSHLIDMATWMAGPVAAGSGPAEPDLGEGAAVQAVCGAIERSAADKRWVDVDEILQHRKPPPGASHRPPQQVGR